MTSDAERAKRAAYRRTYNRIRNQTTIMIDTEVKVALIERMNAQESYNDVLRRLLELSDDKDK